MQHPYGFIGLFLFIVVHSVLGGDPVFISLGATSCVNCQAGQFSGADGSESCSACLPGYFSNASVSSGCTPCPPGTYSDHYGATSCITCPAGTVSEMPAAPSITACQQCSAAFATNPMCSTWMHIHCKSLYYMCVCVSPSLSLSACLRA